MEARLRVEGQAIADAMGMDVEFEKVGGFDPVAFDEGCVTAVRNAAERLGYSHMNLISGAGHDAQMMARICPSAMIFVPSENGISHNPKEHTSKINLDTGANLLFETIRKLDCGYLS